MEGWIKLHRSIIDSPQFADQTVLKVWIWLLCEASIKERNVLLKTGKGKQVIKLKRSQLIFGRNKVAEKLGIDSNAVYRIVNKLADDGKITIESNNQFSIITVKNYNEYQSSMDDEEFEILDFEQLPNNQPTTIEQPSNNQATSDEQLATHNKKVNKGKKENNVKKDMPAKPAAEKIEHYKKLVDTWHLFYLEKFSLKPTINDIACKNLISIVNRLKKLASERNAIWSEVTAVMYLNRFIAKAYEDKWFQEHFSLNILSSKYDEIINSQINGKHKTSSAGDGKTLAFDRP